MCSHHIILHEGKVAQSGTLAELGSENGGGVLSLTLLTKEWSKGLLKQFADLTEVEKVALMPTSDEATTIIQISIDRSAVDRILQWCTNQNLSIAGHQWREPSLEEVFLNVVGVER